MYCYEYANFAFTFCRSVFNSNVYSLVDATIPCPAAAAADSEKQHSKTQVLQQHNQQHQLLIMGVRKDILPVATSIFLSLKAQPAKLDTLAKPFLLVLMAHRAFLSQIQNWLCNTALMQGVHERTLIIFTDDGDEALKASLVASKFPVKILRMHLILPPDFQEDVDYETYGYWRLVQVRVQLVLEIIKAEIAFLLFEPDALWVTNPLLDPILSSNEDIVGFDDHEGVPGFGWLRVIPTANVLSMFTELERRFSGHMDRGLALQANDAMNIEGGEQRILYELLMQRGNTSYSEITFKMLSQTKYTSGKWYDGGRGGDGSDQRAACQADGKFM